ncbi:phenoloxidase-activating factor 2-like isoform X1 [Anopheles merus]|uniref:phenoloxidase-activating factor 2-like isoform X1 n=1 Tax=Anopheles merus TaxID=30066 RepID=UPI001BE4099F|nr:phenoloxidase-activating factor 2-like isoform X1 [Anopheles merus]
MFWQIGKVGALQILTLASVHLIRYAGCIADHDIEIPGQQPIKSYRTKACSGYCVMYHQCQDNEIIPAGTGKIFPPAHKEPECPHPWLVCCKKRPDPNRPPTSTIEPPLPVTGEVSNRSTCGFRSRKNLFPWAVIIYREERDFPENKLFYKCGGSLIAPKFVLTVALCVHDKQQEQLVVRAGEWAAQSTLYSYQDRRVAQLITRTWITFRPLVNDLILVYLSEPFQLADNVQPICFPPKGTHLDRYDCFTVGWGSVPTRGVPWYEANLTRVQVPVKPHDICQHLLPPMRPVQPFLCAGGFVGRDMCLGNSTGFPLACPIPGSPHHYYQAGIVAWSNRCDDNGTPGIYLDMAHYREWIERWLVRRTILETNSIVVCSFGVAPSSKPGT